MNNNTTDTDTAYQIIEGEISSLIYEAKNPLAVCWASVAASIDACYKHAPDPDMATDVILYIIHRKHQNRMKEQGKCTVTQ